MLRVSETRAPSAAVAPRLAPGRLRDARWSVLPTGDLVGLSSLAPRGDGTFWSTPERQHVLYGFRWAPSGTAPPAPVATLPIDGVPPDADVEGLAFLGPREVALGLERQTPGRSTDPILLARIEGGRARVHGALTFDYGAFGLTAPANQGVEGLAQARDLLIAAGEPVGRTADGRRFAPVIAFDRRSGGVKRHRLLLSSADGRVSALAARPTAAGRVEVLAVERHYGTSRILRFHLPQPGLDVEPELLMDLAGGPAEPDHPASLAKLAARPAALPRGPGALPNFEGVGVDGGRIVLVSDNDHGGVDGPTWLLSIPYPAPSAGGDRRASAGADPLRPQRWIEAIGRAGRPVPPATT